MFAKTDLVPVKPEGEGWTLESNNFFPRSVCKCGHIFSSSYMWGEPIMCPICGADKESCAVKRAVLSNTWTRDVVKEVTSGGTVWYTTRPKPTFMKVTETTQTYGPWQPIEYCSQT